MTNKNMTNKNIKLAINLESPEDIKELIKKTENGIYGSTSESDENVVVYMQQNKGMDIHYWQKNGWIRVDEYDTNGYKVSETFSGRWDK